MGITAKPQLRPDKLKVLDGDISVTVRIGNRFVERGERNMHARLQHEIAMDFIRTDPHTVTLANLGYRSQLLPTERPADGVVRIAEQQGLRAR